MSQNIYNNPTFFAEYKQIPRSVEGLEGAAEWRFMRELVGSVTGNRILDLGCGYGWFSRWAVESGAQSVYAIDISEKMLQHAKTFPYDDKAITYECKSLDAEDLDFPANSFDLAYSSLCFDHLPTETLRKLFKKVSHALKSPGGRFVFSVPHPMVLASGETRWRYNAQGQAYWPMYNYMREGLRSQHWLKTDGVHMYHRMMQTYISLLNENGFVLKDLRECWDDEVARVEPDKPENAEHGHRPYFLLIKAEVSARTD